MYAIKTNPKTFLASINLDLDEFNWLKKNEYNRCTHMCSHLLVFHFYGENYFDCAVENCKCAKRV